MSRRDPRRYKRIERRIRAALFHRGDRYECALCGGRFGRFLPAGVALPVLSELRVVGGGYRENARCPACRAGDRERAVWLYLRDHTDLLQRRPRVLHVAPEPELRRALRRHGVRLVTADLHRPGVDVRLDVSRLPFRDASFDALICNHVLEHVPDDLSAMRELRRVLVPGGLAILQVPIALALEVTREDPTVRDPRERERLFGQSDHVRIYAAPDYGARLEQAGFGVTTVGLARQLGAESVRRNALLPEEKIFVATRPPGHEARAAEAAERFAGAAAPAHRGEISGSAATGEAGSVSPR